MSPQKSLHISPQILSTSFLGIPLVMALSNTLSNLLLNSSCVIMVLFKYVLKKIKTSPFCGAHYATPAVRGGNNEERMKGRSGCWRCRFESLSGSRKAISLLLQILRQGLSYSARWNIRLVFWQRIQSDRSDYRPGRKGHHEEFLVDFRKRRGFIIHDSSVPPSYLDALM